MTFSASEQTYVEDIADHGVICPACNGTALGVHVADMADEFGYEKINGVKAVDIRTVPTRSGNLRYCVPSNCKYEYYLHP